MAARGDLEPVADDDPRLQLRIIDVKLTSEPGPHYFAELAYYAVTLAAWLRDHDLDQQYTVSADPAVWPGSEAAGSLAKAIADGVPGAARYQALHDDLETAPLYLTRLMLLTCGAPLADGVFIGHGLSFEVAVLGCAAQAVAGLAAGHVKRGRVALLANGRGDPPTCCPCRRVGPLYGAVDWANAV